MLVYFTMYSSNGRSYYNFAMDLVVQWYFLVGPSYTMILVVQRLSSTGPMYAMVLFIQWSWIYNASNNGTPQLVLIIQ